MVPPHGDGSACRSCERCVVALFTGGINLPPAAVSPDEDLIFAEMDGTVCRRVGGQHRENNLLMLVSGNGPHQENVGLILAVLGEINAFGLFLDFVGPAILRSKGEPVWKLNYGTDL